MSKIDYNRLMKSVNRETENYKRLAKLVETEHKKRIDEGSKRPSWTTRTGIIAQLRINAPDLIEQIFPTPTWTPEFIRDAMKEMLNPTAGVLTKKGEGKGSGWKKLKDEKKNLLIKNKQQENEIILLKKQKFDLNEKCENLKETAINLREENSDLQDKNEDLSNQLETTHYSIDVNSNKDTNVSVQKPSFTDGFYRVLVIVLVAHNFNSQIFNGVRFVLEKTLETLP